MPLASLTDPHVPVTSLFSLKGKVAAVTGGSRGIGLEVCRGLAEAGATVAMIYTQSENAENTASTIAKQTSSTVKAYKSDVRDKDAISATIDQIAADFGKLDICVANAGIGIIADSLECSTDDMKAIMAVNLEGAMYTAQAAGRLFKKQGSGPHSMIFTASVSATLVSTPQRHSAYNASKAAVVHYARSLAVEWADFGRVNTISPGYVATDMLSVLPEEWKSKWLGLIPGGRLADPAELKGAYVFLASDASSYMTGVNMIIDGGLSLS